MSNYNDVLELPNIMFLKCLGLGIDSGTLHLSFKYSNTKLRLIGNIYVYSHFDYVYKDNEIIGFHWNWLKVELKKTLFYFKNKNPNHFLCCSLGFY